MRCMRARVGLREKIGSRCKGAWGCWKSGLGRAGSGLCLILLPGLALGQTQPDTTRSRELQEVEVTTFKPLNQQVQRLPDLHQTYLMAGKKTEVITLEGAPANLAEKTGRQVFAKVPGAFVYDMDGSGNQLNLATRGLDPHRSWEYNVRQNGIMLNSDIYGYPASHYSPPLEAIERVELVRGTASLQYGAQFGGLINYVTKQPDPEREVSFESLNSAGSFGLFSSYNAVGGRKGRFSYYAYYHRRVSDGYRRSSRSDAQSQFVSLGYEASPTLRLRAELGRSQYLHQNPGPLTDSMFYADPRQATRTRNFFRPDIYVPSLTLDWDLSPRTRLSWVSSAVLGTRASVQFVGFANQPDAVDPATGQFRPRQVDIDGFNSYASELRVAHQYQTGSLRHTLVGGLRLTHNTLHRRQLGRGTTGTDFDLRLTEPAFGRDLRYRTRNAALFVEHLTRITPRLSLSPGLRVEEGQTRMAGTIRYLAPEQVPAVLDLRFPLFGLNTQFQLSPTTRLYGGWSQAYRPVLFSDLIPPSPLDRTDPTLRNASGHNAELGARGEVGEWLTFDVSLFQVLYRDRIGTQVLTEASGQSVVLKTNTGTSRTDGLELFVEGKLWQTKVTGLSVFTSTSYMHARYTAGTLAFGGETRNLTGNYLETVPAWISRNGLQYHYRTFQATLLYSYVAESFSDPLNTEQPTANGGRGVVPAYGVWDLNTSLRLGGRYTLKAGVNNLTNRQYFTKRPALYPGPGVWSSDGRSVVVAFGVRI